MVFRKAEIVSNSATVQHRLCRALGDTADRKHAVGSHMAGTQLYSFPRAFRGLLKAFRGKMSDCVKGRVQRVEGIARAGANSLFELRHRGRGLSAVAQDTTEETPRYGKIGI